MLEGRVCRQGNWAGVLQALTERWREQRKRQQQQSCSQIIAAEAVLLAFGPVHCCSLAEAGRVRLNDLV